LPPLKYWFLNITRQARIEIWKQRTRDGSEELVLILSIE